MEKSGTLNIRAGARYDIVTVSSMGVRLTPANRQPVEAGGPFELQSTSAETNVLNVSASLGRRTLVLTRFVEGSADDLGAFPDGSFDAVLDFCILHHVEGWRSFFDECRRVLKDGGCIYIADLSRSCIHIVDALLHWDHAEEALFSFEELEREANRRGFRTVKKAIDLGLEGYFRFQKE